MIGSKNRVRSILYDANCIIYHCFFATERYKKRTIQFKYPELSEKTQNLTNFFCKENITILTISDVWEEIFTKGVAAIVEELIRDYCTYYYGIFKRRRFPPVLKLKLNKKLERKILGLREKEWFKVVDFTPSQEEVVDVVNFYLSQKKSKTMQEIKEFKGRYTDVPSKADINLLKYSQINKIPVLTNDKDLIGFKKELEKRSLCYKIYPLSKVKTDQLERNFR